MKTKKLQKLGAISVVSLNLIATLNSCAFQKCEIEGEHIHLYKNPNTGLARVIDSEKSQVEDYEKTTTTKVKTPLEKFISTHCLINIADCESSIIEIMTNAPHIITRYNSEGIPCEYEVTYLYKFLRINYDPQSNQYYLDELYTTSLEEREPGFNYIDESDFIYQKQRPTATLKLTHKNG